MATGFDPSMMNLMGGMYRQSGNNPISTGATNRGGFLGDYTLPVGLGLLAAKYDPASVGKQIATQIAAMPKPPAPYRGTSDYQNFTLLNQNRAARNEPPLTFEQYLQTKVRDKMPSTAIQNWEFLQTLSPEDQKKFQAQMRPVRWHDTGAELIPVDAEGNQVGRAIQKQISPEADPDLKEKQAKKAARGASIAKRQSETIEMGIDASRAMPIINRSIELLDFVKTGGIDQAILKAKQVWGIESADEAELTNLLGKSVLSQLKPIFGAAFTAVEGQLLISMEAGLGKSASGNKRILRQLKKMLDKKLEDGLRVSGRIGDTDSYQTMLNWEEMTLKPDKIVDTDEEIEAMNNY